jgi:hypothetical protein
VHVLAGQRDAVVVGEAGDGEVHELLGLGAGEQVVPGGGAGEGLEDLAEGRLAAVPGGGEGLAASVVAQLGAGDVAGRASGGRLAGRRAAGSKLAAWRRASRRVSWTMSSASPGSRSVR